MGPHELVPVGDSAAAGCGLFCKDRRFVAADDGEAVPGTMTWGVCLGRQTPSSRAMGKVQICKMT